MGGQERIRDFVHHVLGCICPDRVFDHIEDRMVASSASPHTRSITIGGRLLIYIWHVREYENFRENLFALLETGRKERDERNLNRFRAVLSVIGPLNAALTRAQFYFSRYAGRDDRMHIHVIPPDDIRDI